MQERGINKFFRKFPVIHLGDFVMRKMRESDAERYLQIYQDRETSRYLSDEDVPNSLEESKRAVRLWGGLFEQKRSVFWTLANRKDDVMVGNVGFTSFYPQNRRCEISYDLDKELWGKGIMKKAAEATLSIAFNDLNMYRIEARTMIGNERSQGLLKRLNFKEEATLRGYRIIRGNPTDIKLFSLLKPEYKPNMN